MNFGRQGFYNGERNLMGTFGNNSGDIAIVYNSTASSLSPSSSQSQSQSQSQAHLERTLVGGVEKEHMFDKVVTPSDVGKLNRLVIPKQHAEKYFPLDSSSNEKGLLLSFEDRNGKSWRFRYSYWNSSQSYVMTKGWSRFVKDKRLEAGDIVSFGRGLRDSSKDLLFIDWKRRPTMLSDFSLHRFPMAAMTPWQPLPSTTLPNYTSNGLIVHRSSTGFNYGNINAVKPIGGPVVYDSVPVVHGKAAAKRLRLFGVNMDCPISSADSDQRHDTSSSSSLSANNDVTTTALSHATLVPQTMQLSSSVQWPLNLRLYNGVPLSSSTRGAFLNKGKSSSSSLDLDM